MLGKNHSDLSPHIFVAYVLVSSQSVQLYTLYLNLSWLSKNLEYFFPCGVKLLLGFSKKKRGNLLGNKLRLDTVQDFLIKLGIKPRMMYLQEISIFLLNHVIVRHTKIMNRADKNWAHFQKTKYSKNQSFQKIPFVKVDLLVKYSLQKKTSERFG